MSARSLRLALLLVPLFLSLSCAREKREFRPPASTAVPAMGPRGGTLHAGPAPESLVAVAVVRRGQYRETAYGIAEGKRLFQAYNCVGCHSNGGGGMGPALMDETWLYGSRPEQIYTTIVMGRRNGMPSFGGRIPAYQLWEIVAYVRSLAGLADPQAAPGRDDHLEVRPAEASLKREHPRYGQAAPKKEGHP